MKNMIMIKLKRKNEDDKIYNNKFELILLKCTREN